VQQVAGYQRLNRQLFRLLRGALGLAQDKLSDEVIPDEFVGDRFAIATGNYQVKKYRRI